MSFRQKQPEIVGKTLFEGKILTGKGLNQEVGLQRPENTHWSSHFRIFCNFITMFSPIVSVLDTLVLAKDDDVAKTQAILHAGSRFVNAMLLLRTTKTKIQKTRDEGWDSLESDVKSFCVKHDIDISSMDELSFSRDKFRVIGIVCLNPTSSSSNYNKEKILKMTTLYSDDYDDLDFVMNFSIDEQFSNLSSLSELSNTLVSSKLHQTYPTFYKLLKFGLMLLVFTTTVERVFSVMKIN
ncbi:uncharacterized protein LOC130823176 [Amaranthus tricolor]|uniref:uncharacterized protein LOC130823176 n=1 Tax=Amaranthus tricolor TaxID=29722 RepID=UPI00258A4B6E|nr:uncharacterized protein LOC130823176 [Amaranthus tricolor]